MITAAHPALAVAIICGLMTAGADASESSQAIEESFSSAEFRLIYRRAELPERVVAYLLELAPELRGDKSQLIAEPGEEFDPSCSPGDSSPAFRLVYAGDSENVSFALVESGGIAHSLILAIIAPSPRGNIHCWYSLGLHFTSLSDLRREVSTRDPSCGVAPTRDP